MVVARAGLLLPAPLADLLARRAAQYAVQELERDDVNRSLGLQTLAAELGYRDPRKIAALINGKPAKGESGFVRVETADVICTRLGAHVGELYGELYDLPMREWKDGCHQYCEGCGAQLREPARLCGFCEAELPRKAPRRRTGAFPSARGCRVPSRNRTRGTVAGSSVGGNKCIANPDV